MEHEPEAGAIGRLAAELESPAELEESVVEALRREGLLQRRAGFGRGWLVAATIVAFLAGGLLTGLVDRAASPDGVVSPSGGQPLYALLLYQDARFDQTSGAHRPERVEEYRRWVGALREAGRFADGERLASTGLVLHDAGDGIAAAPSALGGAHGRLTGFFLIEAEDDAEARAIAEACPHLAHGGTVEVRRIERGG